MSLAFSMIGIEKVQGAPADRRCRGLERLPMPLPGHDANLSRVRPMRPRASVMTDDARSSKRCPDHPPGMTTSPRIGSRMTGASDPHGIAAEPTLEMDTRRWAEGAQDDQGATTRGDSHG
jgi:hypothetical protein